MLPWRLPREAPPTGLSADERHAWDQLDFFYKNGPGHAIEMSNRSQTLYSLMDSPVGLAAWMIDRYARSEELITRAFDGKPLRFLPAPIPLSFRSSLAGCAVKEVR